MVAEAADASDRVVALRLVQVKVTPLWDRHQSTRGRFKRLELLLRQLGNAKGVARKRGLQHKVGRIEEMIRQAKRRKAALADELAYLRIHMFVKGRGRGGVYDLNEWLTDAMAELSIWESGELAELYIKLARQPAIRASMRDSLDYDWKLVGDLEVRIAELEAKTLPFVKVAITRLCAMHLLAVVDGKMIHK